MNATADIQDTLHTIRTELLNQLLMLYAVFGFLIFLVAYNLISIDGLSLYAAIQLTGAASLVILALVRNRVPLQLKGHLLVICFTTLGVNSLISTGIAGRGTLLIILACLIAFFALSRREGKVSAVLGLVLIIIVGYLQSNGLAPLQEQSNTKLLNQANWVNTAVFYCFMAASLLIMLGRFQQLVESLLATEHENVVKLASATQEAEQANAAKTEFLSRMSHELRTPLNAILGFTELLQINPDKKRADHLDSIRIAGEHLLALINEVLDLMGIEEGHLVLDKVGVDLGPIVDECLVLVSTRAATDNISLKGNVIDGPIKINGDPLRVKQVLLNLLSNAVKYNRPDGSVQLQARPVDKDWIEIDITDTGIGIAEEDADKVFEPFTRFGSRKINVDGTGVGLTITRQLIELMGGEIRFSSELNVGSKFTVTLPRL